MEEFLKNKKTSDILLHELMKCSRILMSSSHRFRGGRGHKMGHCQGHFGHFGRNCSEESGFKDIQKIGQGRALAFLLEKDGISQKELCAVLRIAPASVSELINKLENGGYIEKRQNEDDKRVTNIFLTEGGRFFAQKMNEERTRFSEEIFSALSEDEQKKLLLLLQKLMKPFLKTDLESDFGDFKEESED